MKLNPYLHFNGNCREAMEFYAEVLGGKVLAMMNVCRHAIGPARIAGDTRPDRACPPGDRRRAADGVGRTRRPV